MGEFSRVNRPVEKSGAFYTRLSPWYDLLASSEKRFIRRGLEMLDPRPGEWILEIGFGTGYAQERLIPMQREGFNAAVDLSPGMAFQARKNLKRAGVLGQSGLVLSDSLPLPFPPQTFDGLFSSFTLELFDTPLIPTLLSDCRRVLKPEGRLVVVCLSKDQPLGVMGRLYEVFHARFPALADCRPIPLGRLLKENGFKIIDRELDRIWGIPVILAESKPQQSLKTY